MTYEIFTADTIAGKYRVAIKIQKNSLPTDNRSDAYTLVMDQFGRGARLSQQSVTVKKLADEFLIIPSAPGWGAIARGK